MPSCRSRKTGNCLDWSKKKRLPQKVSETSQGIFLFPDRLLYAPGGELRGLAAAPAPVTAGARLGQGKVAREHRARSIALQARRRTGNKDLLGASATRSWSKQ